MAPMIVRGEVILDDLCEFGGRGGDLAFLAPDPARHADRLPLQDPGRLAPLYELSFEDILDYLKRLGDRLDMATNEHLQEACRLSYRTAPTTPPIVDASFAALGTMFRPETIREMAEESIGVRYLEGWVEEELEGLRLGVRCFGARTLHIIAGNSPMISALTIIRNAVLRSDAIIKAPSNDPFTAIAIAHTMIDMAPDHPITKSVSVAYWRGGDEAFEERLYQPWNIEKIMAWGGFASVKHVTRYIQPGLELISLDPKRSASIIGPEAFTSEAAMSEAAQRLATDIGAMNQVGCVNARVIYVLCGTEDDAVEKLQTFGEMTYKAMLDLPDAISTVPKSYDRDLKAEVDALRLSDDWYTVIGGSKGEGAIIVSHMSDPVEFATRLNDRTANLVPVDELSEVVGAVDAYTQTVGVYPESFKTQLRDVLPLYGAQRFVSLGHAVEATLASAQDGIEPMRRMGKWIIDEIREN